ncbi:putative hydrolase [Sphingobium sp. SYK-6]|uniref:amidohydrolase family protein n=1 Tax=Sphingobium sp. (strain NBRC 103272 / SYK-6) TaxID=627192 RepID=UPI00022773AD|nr:amidohydrolase family protein [Sphingobium sp. SYK-6]BAK66000.1 putative hydrolase [Sphingobium sp. SYK-6]
MRSIRLLASSLAVASVLASSAALAETESFSVIYGQKPVGHMTADVENGKTSIVFDYKNNGRGPTIAETLATDASGLPTSWTVTGSTTFGSKVDERFSIRGRKATWTDSTGSGSATVSQPSLYVPQSGSPWSLWVQASQLLRDADNAMPALPGGTLRLAKGEAFQVKGEGGDLQVTTLTISGVDLNPSYLAVDPAGKLFAFMTPEFVVVRKGYEGEEARLRGIAERLSTQRYVDMQTRFGHRYGKPVRITNVRLFDPAAMALTAPVSVVVSGERISAVEPLDSPATPGEVRIDGGGGTLIPGLTDMHGHLDQDSAMLNILAGITTVRDMGNDNAVLDQLVDRMDRGEIAGPRVVRSGFIEGKSQFNANNGILVGNQAEALDAVRWYAARDFWQIKVYNSMNPAWVPAMVEEAHRLGLRVTGHVPAFTNADAMIAAGYDELTHINQVILGWVLAPDEDPRTLLRITALKRLPGLDLGSAPVRKTLDSMAAKKIALDPTLVIHEQALLGRDGTATPNMADVYDYMPVSVQRSLKQQMLDTSAAGDDAAYRAAFDQIVATIRAMHERGIFIVPGTDLGGAFNLHRELELYQKIGMTPAQILKRATLDVQAYIGQDQSTGSIAKGKLADFFLIPGDPLQDLKATKRIAMVMKGGVAYFPAEAYPEFGIKPLAQAPEVTGAE